MFTNTRLGSRVESLASSLNFSILTALFFRGLGAGSTLLLGYILARRLPGDQAGYLFISISIVVIAVAVGMLGLNVSLLRFVSLFYAQRSRSQLVLVVAQSWSIAAITLTSVSLAVFFLADTVSSTLLHKPELSPVVKAIAPAIVLTGFCYVIANQLQAVGQGVRSLFVSSIGIPLLATAAIYLLNIESAHSGALVYVASASMVLAIALFCWVRFMYFFDPGVSGLNIGDYGLNHLVSSSMPLWAVAVMIQLTLWGTHLVAGIYVSAQELAHLSIAQRLSGLVSFVLIAVNFAIAPKISHLYSEGKREEIARLLYHSRKVMFLVAIPLAAILSFFSRPIMTLFGEGYSAGFGLLVVLCLGQLVNGCTGSVGQLLTMSGHERDMRNIVVATGFLSLLLAFLLVPFYGPMGAAIATASAVALQNLVAAHKVNKRMGIGYFGGTN